ncbi:MAG: hypothetical protein WED10_00295 [Brumimicrobium sp.]
MIEKKYIDKSVDEIAENLSNPWVVELPIKNHYKKSELPAVPISSKYPLYLATWILSKLLFFSKIQNEPKLKEVLKELNISVDYKNICKTYYAQYRVMLFLGKWHQFKSAYVVCHYTNMGYIRALRKLDIPVIEVQHGLISNSHCAYNIYTPTDLHCYPNYLLTLGEREASIFENDNLFMHPENIFPVGHVYIDYISSTYAGDKKLKEIQTNYKKTVAVVSQKCPLEEQLIDFIRKASELDKSILYIFIPRFYTKEISEYAFPENVVFTEWLNVYQIIWHADIHSTMYSTCALEAPSIGVKNVLINIENKSKLFFEGILNDENITKYSDEPEQFLEMVNATTPESKSNIIEKNASIILPNYKKNIKNFIENIKHR